MNVALFYLLLPLSLTILAAISFSLYVFLKTPGLYRLKLILIPLLLIGSVYSYQVIGTMLGSAKPITDLPDKFVFLAYNVVIINDVKTSIEVWTKIKDTKLYVVPWSKPLEQQLLEARKKKAGAGENEIMIERIGRKRGMPGQHNDTDEYPFGSRMITPSEVMPKRTENMM